MDYFFLSNTALFNGIKENEIRQIVSCLDIRKKAYEKNETVYRAGDTVHDIGLVTSGSVNIVVNFYYGSSQIFGHIKKGDIFAENYAAVPDRELICDVVADDDSEIIFLNFSDLIAICNNGCSSHQRLLNNLLRISALKSLSLSSRMLHIAPRSIRDRLLSYLSEQAIINGSRHFTIPFAREQLANYLGVNRSAMSNELSKMQKDGLIRFTKNEFILSNK